MAETLPHGPVVPNRTDRISKSGVDEIRTLGASVSGGLGTALSLASTVDAESKSRDADLADQIAGMEGMDYVGAWEPGYVYRINDVVTYGGDSWARLTAGSTGTPGSSPANWGLVARKGDGGGFGDLNETEVVGLYDTVEGSMTQDQVVGLTAALATKRDVAPMVIAQGTNLNDVTTPGEHSQQFTAWATPELNYPGGASPVAGRLFVAANVARTQVTQFYVPFTTSKLDIWMRNFYVSWGSWERIGMASDLALKANLTHPALYTSGWRDITSLIPVPVTSGNLYLARSGSTVWLDFSTLRITNLPTNNFHRWSAFLPTGFRPSRNMNPAIAPTMSRSAPVEGEDSPKMNAPNWAMGPLRISAAGEVIVYDACDAARTTVYPIQGLTSWMTIEAPPATLPGAPA